MYTHKKSPQDILIVYSLRFLGRHALTSHFAIYIMTLRDTSFALEFLEL